MRSRFLTYLAAGVVALATALQAQVSSVAPRIVSPIDDQSLTTLKGNIAPVARAEFDKGKASPSTHLRNVRLVLSRSPEQQAALDSLMAAQLDKNSPEYHHWLTPEEFDHRFGAADSDIAAITAWLQSQGLTVEKATSTGSSIAFSGTVNQIEKAFHLSMHAFQREGDDYIANITEPRIPTALAPVIAGIARLSTYAPRPHMVKGRSGMFNPGSGFAESSSPARTPRPELTTSGPFLWITAADAATMYNSPNSYNANFSSGTSYTGKGVTIGIGGVNDINASTVVNYRTRFLNGDITAPTITNIDGSAIIDLNGATDEAYIDNELAGGMAPAATIHFYTADQKTDGGITTVINQVIKDNSVDIFSLSFGLCEMDFSGADNQSINDAWKQMAAQGIAVTVSTGDSGAAGCDDPNSQPNATRGLQVNGLASTPYNIAVGGTDTYGLLSGFSTYVNNNQSATNSYRSVLSYIPESTWNDSTTTDGKLANNVPTGLSTSNTNIVGGSGGVSSCSTQSTSTGACVSGYPKPSWQRGPGVPNDNARDLPDVSLMAGNGFDNAAWLICTDDSAGVPGTTYTNDCSTQGDGNFYFTGFGGTSTSAPAFAGILALVQESRGGSGHRLGADALKTLYDLYNGSNASAVFHDTTQGNISVYCGTGSPNCQKNTAGYPFLTGYDTTPGYDLATGMGSVNAANLITYWGAATGTAAATVTVTPSSNTITIADSLTVNVTVAGSSGTPTGTVSLKGGGYTSSNLALDGTGKASFTIPAGSLSAGSVTLTVTYNGDVTYAGTTGTASVTVNKLSATVTVTPASSSIYTDQPLSVTVKVTGAGATPTGTVTLASGSYSSAATSLTSGSATITIPANSLSAGTASLSASYSGDSSYATATGTGSLTVSARLTPTVTVTPASSSISVADPLSVTVKVTGSGGTPTGTVTLSGGGYASSATTLSAGQATFNIPANSLTPGAVTLTASYSGDTAYATGSGTSPVTVKALTPLTPTVTVTPASTSLDPSQSLDVTVKVAGAGATPTGTVTLSSGSFTSAATTLSSGSATITIPANTFSAVGSVTLTAAYSGDTVYASGSGTGSVTINAPYSLTATAPAAVTAGGSVTSTVTVKSDGVYAGTVAMSCSLTNSPTGAQKLPICTFPTGASLTFDATHTSQTATVSFSTTAATSAGLDRRGLPGLTGAGGAVLALLVFFGIPARRRAWRAMLGLLVLVAALSTLSACGSHNSGTGGTGGGTPGTTAGTYTFTVTGTGTPAVTPAPTTTVTLTVN